MYLLVLSTGYSSEPYSRRSSAHQGWKENRPDVCCALGANQHFIYQEIWCLSGLSFLWASGLSISSLYSSEYFFRRVWAAAKWISHIIVLQCVSAIDFQLKLYLVALATGVVAWLYLFIIIYELEEVFHGWSKFLMVGACFVFLVDSLVLHLQLVYDGHFSHWPSLNDSDAYSPQWLCQICPWGGWFGDIGKQ